MKCADVRFVKELYPRLKPIDDVIERYRDALDRLPPIVVARGGVLVDGYHRWQAHVREDQTDIPAEDLGDLTDAEIRRESIKRNASHGQQLSRNDKQRLAASLWRDFQEFKPAERVNEICALLGVSRDAVERWTKDARAQEKQEQQDAAWDMWLDCLPQTHIAKKIDVEQQTVSNWLQEIRKRAEFVGPPESLQHFDIWHFHQPDDTGGAISYFGNLAPQIMENLLWFYTNIGDTIVDLFAGSGTTIEVAKRIGRRVWASDIRGNAYSPYLPIHQHDAVVGWPTDAPNKASLIFLDPPYWKQARGQYSTEPNELAEITELDDFYNAWHEIAKTCMAHTERIAYIISPTQMEDGTVIDHATDMTAPFHNEGWHIERRIIVPYSTQQATGQQVEWARNNKRMLKLYRDLVILRP